MLLERAEFATPSPEETLQQVAKTELEPPYRVIEHNEDDTSSL
jgi:hypothetical protein